MQYSKDNLPDGLKTYARKHPHTQAVLIQEDFEVLTASSEEPVKVEGPSWLAVDPEGEPYPIATHVFDSTFHPTPLGEPYGGSAWKEEDLA